MSKSLLCGFTAVVLIFGNAAALSADSIVYAAAQTGTGGTETSTFGVLDLTTGVYTQTTADNYFVTTWR